jgi:hypothetical protein
VSQFAGAESSFLLPVSLYLFRIDKGAHADPLGRSVRLARQRAPIRAVPACLGPWPCLSPSRHLISAHGALPLLMAPCLCSWHLVSAHGTLSLLMAPCLCSWHLVSAHGTLSLLMAPCLCSWHLVSAHGTLPVLMAPYLCSWRRISPCLCSSRGLILTPRACRACAGWPVIRSVLSPRKADSERAFRTCYRPDRRLRLRLRSGAFFLRALNYCTASNRSLHDST